MIIIIIIIIKQKNIHVMRKIYRVFMYHLHNRHTISAGYAMQL